MKILVFHEHETITSIDGDDWAVTLRCLAQNGRRLTRGATTGFEPPAEIRNI